MSAEPSISFRIRAAEPDDAALVALLGRITFAETFGPLFERHPDDLGLYLQATFGVAKIRRSLAGPGNSYRLAFADDLPVGYAKLKYPSATGLLPEADAAQLQKIYVLRDFLGRGLGLPLLEAAVTRAASLQASAVWLSVLRQNTRAIRFYRRRGFEALGRHGFTIGAQTFDFDALVRPLS